VASADVPRTVAREEEDEDDEDNEDAGEESASGRREGRRS